MQGELLKKVECSFIFVIVLFGLKLKKNLPKSKGCINIEPILCLDLIKVFVIVTQLYCNVINSNICPNVIFKNKIVFHSRPLWAVVQTQQRSCIFQLSIVGIGWLCNCLCLFNHAVRSHETICSIGQSNHWRYWLHYC